LFLVENPVFGLLDQIAQKLPQKSEEEKYQGSILPYKRILTGFRPS